MKYIQHEHRTTLFAGFISFISVWPVNILILRGGFGFLTTSYISVCPSPGLGFTSTFVVVIFMFKRSRFDRTVVHFVLVGIMSIITVYSRLSIHIDLFLSLKCRYMYMHNVSFLVFCYFYLVFCCGFFYLRKASQGIFMQILVQHNIFYIFIVLLSI